MINCKRHGITYIGKMCKKCAKELEKKNSYRYYTPPPALDRIDLGDVTEIVSPMMGMMLTDDGKPTFDPDKSQSFLAEGSSGGGGASRSFDPEPEKNSDSGNDSCDSGSSDSGSSNSSSSD